MTASYYLWKWADNDLPGKPNDVFSELLRGKMHSALQPFDARPLLKRLATLALDRRQLGEEWNWQVQPANDSSLARFVFLQGPMIDGTKERYRRFSDAMGGLGISGYDEQYGYVIQGMRPKLNCFFWGQHPRERVYDIAAEELPMLLRRIDPHGDDPFAILEDRRHYFVQCYAHKRRFCVEWRENFDTITWKDYVHWRALLPKQSEAPQGKPRREHGHSNHETLMFADTLRIFQAFVQEKPRPSRYHWRDIRRQLEREDARRKKERAAK